ncbi:hypothetical protein N0V93_000804 [Gnomoniopsis smithogilvyi]|uniref:Protein kinase domain-containing protein n=1 Tax=Gnomoniopsis smithogilvyi TaxID=1191159 RepID=A0A9W8Z2G8_9PEZI|nr:hypothetical protein N0V93_000804 [Gnomoniopsis smithogilvyi]
MPESEAIKFGFPHAPFVYAQLCSGSLSRKKKPEARLQFMAAPNMDLDLDLNLDSLAAASAAGPGAAPEKPTNTFTHEPKSRWSSTSSIESDADNFWHDSSALDHFYTTQDTANTLDSLDFNNHDGLFFGPFDTCNTGVSHNQTQDSARHLTEASVAGVESIDFASTSMPNLQQLDSSLDLSQWSLPLVDSSSSSLKDRLNAALTRGDGGRLFVPDNALKTILSSRNVLQELQKHYLSELSAIDLQELAGQISTNVSHQAAIGSSLLRTFAILLLVDRAHDIHSFRQEGLSDMTLPLTKAKAANGEGFELRREDAPGVHLGCFDGWSQHDIEAFEKLQWRVVVPVFSDTPKQQFLDLEDQAVLPYIESWENKEHDHFKGGNSEVWKVKIHDAHHTFQNLNTTVPNNPYLAIKKLKSKDDEAFRREVRNLQRLHNAEHPNLLNLLATYKYKGHYHLVFPWADGDLRRLWRSTPNPQAGKEEMRWLAQQCASIASALKSVHAGAESWIEAGGDGPSDKQRMAMNKFGIHGDIKPENIFIFSKGQQKSFKALCMGPPNTSSDGSSTSPSERSSRGGSPSSAADEFVLGDFGSGGFFGPSSNPDPLHQITVTYRPPEYDTKLRPVSRSWDVWGLGCTYLEFVTWFLLGPSGLTEFAKRRTTRTAAGKLSDHYFETFIDGSQDGGVGATLKGSVLAWINDLCNHKNASQFIRDFLDFITHRMFIVENASITRASGAEVADYLNELVRKCFDSDAYCIAYPTVESPWHIDSTGSSLTMAPSAVQNDFTNLDFTATTEDVAASAAWHLSTLNDLGALAQWNTSPIVPTTSFPSLDCTEMLSGWNYTAPVAWDFNNTANSPAGSVEKKRKRQIEDVSDELDRRVSPKTSTSIVSSSLSPETARSSSAVESPATEPNAKQLPDKRFACPYYKNNPLKFRQNAAELLAHQRAAVSCETVTNAFPEGTMLPSQEEVLRVKKRVPPDTTEEQRWAEVYMILFPDADADSMPTPFYEDEPSEVRQNNGQSSKLEEASPNWFCSPSEYEQYLTRSLPPRVQRELERQIQRDFGFFGDENQTGRLIDMVQKLQLRLFKQFVQERKAGVTPDSGG